MLLILVLAEIPTYDNEISVGICVLNGTIFGSLLQTMMEPPFNIFSNLIAHSTVKISFLD